MNKETLIGGEILRHTKRLKEINEFCDMLDFYKIENGKSFPNPGTGDAVECVGINYDRLIVQYIHPREGKTIYRESECYELWTDMLP